MRLSELDGRRVGVWGLGREGDAVVRALGRHAPAARLTLVDESPAPADPRAVRDPAALAACEVVVRSPGVSRYRPEVAALAAAGVGLTTATNLWRAEHGEARWIGITGTKGKSTTSALTAHLAGAAGLRVRLAGNIGVPVLDLVDEDAADVDLWVIELSSYQTSDIDGSPPVGVLLNLFREHTDWHGGSQERYHADKLRLFAHRDDMVSVVNAADPASARHGGDLPHPAWFRREDGWDALPDGGVAHAGVPFAPAGGIPLVGAHNLDNVCAALAALEAAGVATDGLAPALARFRPLAHRLEPLGERDGVLWVNDSIATVPEATVAAARAVAPRPTVLLVGGGDRAQDYAPLAEHLAGASAVVGVVAMPANGGAILERIAASGVPAAMAADLPDAVARARALAPPGGVIVLSPGAPSGADFADFQARGDAFRALSGVTPDT